MKDNPFLEILIQQVRLTGMLIRLVLLRLEYLRLLIRLYTIKAVGAALIEAVKIEYCIKSLSKEDRIAFAACVAVSIYVVALTLLVRM